MAEKAGRKRENDFIYWSYYIYHFVILSLSLFSFSSFDFFGDQAFILVFLFAIFFIAISLMSFIFLTGVKLGEKLGWIRVERGRKGLVDSLALGNVSPVINGARVNRCGRAETRTMYTTRLNNVYCWKRKNA